MGCRENNGLFQLGTAVALLVCALCCLSRCGHDGCPSRVDVNVGVPKPDAPSSEPIVGNSLRTDSDDHSWISEGASGLQVVARAARPVACQRSDRPEQRNQKKQLAPRDARAPCPERTQGWDNGGRRHSRRPHNRSGSRAGLLHGGLLRLHSKKRKMFEQPPEARRPAFWIPGPADRVESEANAKNSSDNPVGDGMAGEIEENPSRDHGDYRVGGRVS